MKYFISAVIGGALVWFIMAKPAQVRSVISYIVDPKAASENGSKTASASPAPSDPHQTAAATPPPLEPAAIKQTAETEHVPIEEVRKKWAASLDQQKRFHFIGTIQAHVKDGHIIVRGVFPSYRGNTMPLGTYAVFGVPKAELMADGMQVDILVVPVGTYEYTGSTMYELVYTDHDKVGQ